METATLGKAEIAEYCRKKGIHTSQIDAWRDACMKANDWEQESSAQLKSATKAADKRTKKLEAELLRKEKALEEAAERYWFCGESSMHASGMTRSNDLARRSCPCGGDY